MPIRLTCLAVTAAVVLSGCGSGSASPEATHSSTAAPAPTTRPAADVALGFSAGELVGMSGAQRSAALDGYTAAGGTVIRFDISWPRVQPDGPGSWDWSAIDPIMSALTARHLIPLPILDYTPVWARRPGCPNQLCEPANPAAFATFAAAAATRYASRGVHSWEVWNEQNISWLPQPDAEAYGTLLQKTSAALHRVDPHATVLVGGLAPALTTAGSSYSPPDFLASLYQQGLRSSFDGVAVHPYSFPTLPGELDYGSGWEQMLKVRSIMVAQGDASKGIWATEFGAPTAGPGAVATYANRNYSEQPDHVDLELQAKMVTQAVRSARQLPWLRVLLWYGLRDLGPDPQTGPMSFGLRYFDGAAKPSYAAWLAAVR